MYDKENKGGRERRREKRYRVRRGALAFVGRIPAEITDISLGGMAVKFTALEDVARSELQMDIFFGEQGFYLPGVPGTICSDIEYPITVPLSAVRVRRLGIRFGELTPEQADRLREFILHNAVAEA
jgi:hypothetical protein